MNTKLTSLIVALLFVTTLSAKEWSITPYFNDDLKTVQAKDNKKQEAKAMNQKEEMTTISTQNLTLLVPVFSHKASSIVDEWVYNVKGKKVEHPDE